MGDGQWGKQDSEEISVGLKILHFLETLSCSPVRGINVSAQATGI